MFTLFILFLISTLCFGISAICGGGAGLVLMPVIGQVVPIAEVPSALSIGTVSSSVSRMIIFLKHIHWPIVWRYVPAALPTAAFGAYLLSLVSPVYLQLLLGLFLISNLYFLFTSKSHTATKLHPRWLYGIGAASGFLSGFTGATGLVFNHFYYQLGISKEQIIATRAANDLLIHLLKIILYFSFGLLSKHSFYAGITVAAAAICSSYLVKYLLPFIKEHIFKKIGYVMTICAGVIMVYSAASHIFIQ